MKNLSICMIVKDEQDNLSKNLPYLTEFIKNGSELIVVDTGSSDSTISIAKKYTPKVFNFKWENNFSKARNFSLSKASNDYVFVLDADERPLFTNLKDILSKIDNFDAVQFLIKNYLPNSSFNIDKQLRIFDKNKAHYESEVHNQLIFIKKPKILNTNLVIEHFGYADQKIVMKKRLRTIKMINESLKKDPKNYYLIQQLARAYFAIKDYKNSFHYANIVSEVIFKKELKVKPNNLFYLESLIISAKSLFELQKYDSIEGYYLQALKIFPDYVDALILLAEFYYNNGKLSKAKEMLTKYLDVHDKLLNSSFNKKIPPCNAFGMKLTALRFLILTLNQLGKIKEFKAYLSLYLSLEKDPKRRENVINLIEK